MFWNINYSDPPNSKRKFSTSPNVFLLFSLITILLAFVFCPLFLIAVDQNHFFFVQISDTHFGVKDHNQLVKTIADKINNLPMPVACVVHTGDIFADNILNKEVLSSATSILSRIKVPLLILPGNHDLTKDSLKLSLNVYTNKIGKLAEEREFNGVKFITLCTEPLSSGLKIKNYDPVEWLEKTLKKTENKPAIIFVHVPPTPDFYKNEMHESWQKEEYTKFKDLLTKYNNIKAIICGHFHRDELHWLENIPIFVSPPIARFYGRQPSFRIYEYNNGKLSYYTVYIE